MATVSVQNKKFSNITDVRIAYINEGNVLSVNMLDSNKKRYNVDIDVVTHRARLEVNGNICKYESGNCMYIIGDVQHIANVGNCAYIEGTLADYENARNKVEFDINIDVEKLYKRSLTMSRQNTNGKFTVIHIDGNLITLVEDGLLGIIKGDIVDCNISNTLYLKGSVYKVIAGNVINSTMGVKKSPERIRTEKLQERRQKQVERDIMNVFDDMFKR